MRADLFRVNENEIPLKQNDTELYHRVTAMLLYLSKKTRPDIQVAVSFLSTRVKLPTYDDWKKLGDVFVIYQLQKTYLLRLKQAEME